MGPTKTVKRDTKKVFWQMGTCSRTFFYLLNREFGHSIEVEEHAADPLAGGVMRKGFQCGMIWGAALAVGTEAYRNTKDLDQAVELAIVTTQKLVTSFKERTHTVNCREITDTDFSKKFQMAKYLLFKAKPCFDLAENWAPEAIEAACAGLSMEPARLSRNPLSCATEVARKMGATDEQAAMVAGFAGGLGLSGQACGALAAAIWMNSMEWSKAHPQKMATSNPAAERTFKKFIEVTGAEVLCHKLCGRRFNSIDEHSEYIEQGGCAKLIEALAKVT